MRSWIKRAALEVRNWVRHLERKFIGFTARNRAAVLVKNISATSPDQDPFREDRVKVTVI